MSTSPNEEWENEVVEAFENEGFTPHRMRIPRDPDPEYDRAVKALSSEDAIDRLRVLLTGPEQFINKAKKLVSTDYNLHLLAEQQTAPDDFYVTWFSKTLQNWKAMVSTDVVNDLYWEVTYDGTKMQSYVDAYTKESNTVYTDDYLDTL